MRKRICLIGCAVLLFALILTVAVMIGLAIADDYAAGNVIWKACWIELIGMAVCAVGSGEFKD